MKDHVIEEGVIRLMQRLDPSLGLSEPTLAEMNRIVEEYGLEDKTLVELARMGFAPELPRKVSSTDDLLDQMTDEEAAEARRYFDTDEGRAEARRLMEGDEYPGPLFDDGPEEKFPWQDD